MVPAIWVKEEAQLPLDCEALGWGSRVVRFGNRWSSLASSYYVLGTERSFVNVIPLNPENSHEEWLLSPLLEQNS